MQAKITYECEHCGAILSGKVMRRLEKEERADICPFCHDQYVGRRIYKLQNVYYCFSNIPDYEFELEAVFIEYDGVSNPRLVIRFDDHYFNDWNSLRFPDGFSIVCTRDEPHFPRPIEMVFTFDLEETNQTYDYVSALHNALDTLLAWIRRFPVCKE